MKNINLSEAEFSELKILLQSDSEEITREAIPFFEQTSLDPKEFIDERVLLCQKFDLDFWQHIKDYCSDYSVKQLQALYEGKDMKEFVECYESPTEEELAKDFLR